MSFLESGLDLFGHQGALTQVENTAEATRLGMEETRRQFDIQQERLDPFFEQAAPAVDLLAKFSGAQGRDSQAQAFQDFKDSPGQEFLKSRGSDATRQLLSKLGGGNDRISLALAEEGSDIAAQDFQNQLNRLSGGAGIAQSTGSQLNQGNQQFATQFGNAQSNVNRAAGQGLANIQQGQNALAGQLAMLGGSIGGGSKGEGG